MTRVALVGSGVVGSSWSLVFARGGLDVVVYDRDPASAMRAIDYVRSALDDPELPKLGLGDDREDLAGVRPVEG